MNKIFDLIVKNHGLCIADATFLVSPCFMEEFYPMLVNYNLQNENSVVVSVLPSSVLDLRKLAGSEDAALAQRAQYALNVVCKAMVKKRNFIEYFSNSATMFSNAVLLSLAVMERLQKPVTVLTQNKRLSADLNSINNLKSCRGEEVSVYCFSEYGKLRKVCTACTDKVYRGTCLDSPEMEK